MSSIAHCESVSSVLWRLSHQAGSMWAMDCTPSHSTSSSSSAFGCCCMKLAEVGLRQRVISSEDRKLKIRHLWLTIQSCRRVSRYTRLLLIPRINQPK
jgi:hypothetical protein